MQNQQPNNHHVPATQLPLSGKVAIYARVATPAKATEKPALTDDPITSAVQFGWRKEQIIVFAHDQGRASNAPINERAGLQALMKAIGQETIKAVLIADESRLFRDADAIQVNTFIRLCEEM